MTIMLRAETDMFRLSPIARFMVNPVSLLGGMSKGISLEFKTRNPKVYDTYIEAIQKNSLHVGDIQVIPDLSVNYSVINLVTKNHFGDKLDISDLRQGLYKIKYLLQKPENVLSTVVMPMLGHGVDVETDALMRQEFYDVFDDLDELITLCVHPDKLGYIPKFLAIVGPRKWANKNKIDRLNDKDSITKDQYQEQYTFIEEGFNRALRYWNLSPSEFDAFVSGGAAGVDTVACGKNRQHYSYKESLAHKYSPQKPIVIQADWDRYGPRAGAIRNIQLLYTCTHFIINFPPKIQTFGTSLMYRMIMDHNKNLSPGDKDYKFVYVWGENATENTKNLIL